MYTTEEGEEKDTTIIIKDCVEPKWLTITSNSSSYYLNIAPIEKKDMTNQQKQDRSHRLFPFRVLQG